MNETTSAKHGISIRGEKVIAYEECADLFHRLLGIGRANKGKVYTHSCPCKHWNNLISLVRRLR